MTRKKRNEQTSSDEELVAAAKDLLEQWRSGEPRMPRLAQAVERLDLAVNKDGKPEDWFAWMVEKRVRLQPVLAADGKTIDWWSAGFTVTGSSGQNIVQTMAQADTPAQALEQLYRGNYTFANGQRVQPPRKR